MLKSGLPMVSFDKNSPIYLPLMHAYPHLSKGSVHMSRASPADSIPLSIAQCSILSPLMGT